MWLEDFSFFFFFDNMNILLEEKFNREGQNRLNVYLKHAMCLEKQNNFPIGTNFFNLSLIKVFSA